MNQIELQQDVERFSGNLVDRIGDAIGPVDDIDEPRVRKEGVRRLVEYASSALDIATGPVPEVNLLDMLVFVRLCRIGLERESRTEEWGEMARPLVEAFVDAEKELTVTAGKLLSSGELSDLQRKIDDWAASQPERRRFEWVRAQEFSRQVGDASAPSDARARSLFSNVRSATQSADKALLLSERALFLGQRAPFLVRMHARLGAQEVTSDVLNRVLHEGLLDQVEQRVTHVLKRFLLLTAAAGAALVVLFWAGYFVAKTLTQQNAADTALQR